MKNLMAGVAIRALLAAGACYMLSAQTVTYAPYIQPGDNGKIGAQDSMVVAWQTSETTPGTAYTVEYGTSTTYGMKVTPTGRVVDNYLAADSNLPIPTGAPGAHVAYTAILTPLKYDTTYFYRVSGPGLPAAGFTASFHSKKISGQYAFAVEGDEGFFPTDGKGHITNYEARIAHLIYDTGKLQVNGASNLPQVDFAINTGDNVYNVGSESSYRDYWFPVWNSDADSNDKGAPLIRSIPYYIVVGNHDTGGNGDFVNMLGGDSGGKFTGNSEGGDNLAYYNNYYYPLNGPAGVDSMFLYNGDTVAQTGWFWSYKGKTYTSPSAADAYRVSTAVDTGNGTKRQIDTMSNYSFDYGNAHFIFLDSDPHLFNALVDYSPTYAAPPAPFPGYPSTLRDWVLNDLDSSKQLWKIAVFHHSPFSSGNGTLRNFQMRSVTKALEDHGVNMVFNGHEHNYQRTFPLRALARVAQAPTTLSEPAVDADIRFDGNTNTVPDGVIYIVDGAGGNRDFDGAQPSPRGQTAVQVSEDDSASGTYTVAPGLVFPQGQQGWLDTNLTNTEMAPFFPNAGQNQKIAAKFKARIFSFSEIVVNNNSLTLYQISEPLTTSSSATTDNPAPYGTDFNGRVLNDPIADNLLDPATGAPVASPVSDGPSALLDRFTITKPDVSSAMTVTLSAPASTNFGGPIQYDLTISNKSQYSLNGVQAVVTLPAGVAFDSDLTSRITLQGRQDVVVTIGRLVPGEKRTVSVPARLLEGTGSTSVTASASVRSSTAQTLTATPVTTNVIALGSKLSKSAPKKEPACGFAPQAGFLVLVLSWCYCTATVATEGLLALPTFSTIG